MITVPDPLSAGFMTMSLCLESVVSVWRSSVVKLSCIFVGCILWTSCSTLFMYESSAGSMFLGGVQLLRFLYLLCFWSVLVLVLSSLL